MFDFTAILFARPSFFEGIARLLDFSGSLNEYNRSATPVEADRLAIAADWAAVMDDLRTAMHTDPRIAKLVEKK